MADNSGVQTTPSGYVRGKGSEQSGRKNPVKTGSK
jgi:hypothetical protein